MSRETALVPVIAIMMARERSVAALLLGTEEKGGAVRAQCNYLAVVETHTLWMAKEMDSILHCQFTTLNPSW